MHRRFSGTMCHQVPDINIDLSQRNYSWWWQLSGAIVFCAVAVMLAKWGTGLPGWRDVIASENGPVERMSAAVWFMGLTWCVAAAYCQRLKAVEWLGVSVLFLLLGLRELDAHVWATGWNLDKLANYWNPNFPLTERLLVLGLMVVPCLVVGVILSFRLWETVLLAWRTENSWFNHLLLALILFVLCLTIDKVGSYVLPVMGVDESGKIMLMEIEEFLEFALSVFTMASLWPYLHFALNGEEG